MVILLRIRKILMGAQNNKNLWKIITLSKSSLQASRLISRLDKKIIYQAQKVVKLLKKLKSIKTKMIKFRKITKTLYKWLAYRKKKLFIRTISVNN